MIAEWNVLFERVAGLSVHVSAFGFDAAAGFYVMIDPRHSWTEVNLLSPSAFDAWIVRAAIGNEVWRIPTQTRTRFWFPGLWCVGTVKRLVGLRSSALSPAGLRRDLLAAGARRVFCEESQSAAGRPDDQGGA